VDLLRLIGEVGSRWHQIKSPVPRDPWCRPRPTPPVCLRSRDAPASNRAAMAAHQAHRSPHRSSHSRPGSPASPLVRGPTYRSLPTPWLSPHHAAPDLRARLPLPMMLLACPAPAPFASIHTVIMCPPPQSCEAVIHLHLRGLHCNTLCPSPSGRGDDRRVRRAGGDLEPEGHGFGEQVYSVPPSDYMLASCAWVFV
jgi:hypothetical protein